MSASDEFFDAKPDGPPRDRYDRPKLYPRGGDERVAYTRASSLADMISDFTHLQKWQMRYLARSMGHNRDLAMLAAAECYTTGFDKGEEKANRESGRRLDEIIERALDRQGIHEKADYGTAVHGWTDPGNDGTVFDEAKADVDSFHAFCRDNAIVHIGTELFTANDTLRVAGTFDHLSFVPGYGIVIGDKKTSSKVKGKDYAIQLAGYRDGDLYDWENDEEPGHRISLEDYLERMGWDSSLLRHDVGLIYWIKNGTTTAHEVDLHDGFEAAKVAIWVRDVHRRGPGARKVDKEVAACLARDRDFLSHGLRTAPTVESLLGIWRRPDVQAIWIEEHTAIAVQRKGELDA